METKKNVRKEFVILNKENKSIKIIKKNIPTAESFIQVIDDNMHISKHFWYQPKENITKDCCFVEEKR